MADGAPFTADDVIYTLRSMGNPADARHYAVANVRLHDVKKLGTHTVRVPLQIPIADLQGYFLVAPACYVLRERATNFHQPLGTGGPYRLQSFDIGRRTVLTANRDYWDHPRPYQDSVEIIDLDDDTARLNALVGGQIDICYSIPPAVAKANLESSQYSVLVGAPGYGNVFYMRTDQAPFSDVRVRQALRLIVDRPAMIETALDGFGIPGNDLLGHGLPYYDHNLPQRTQDIEQAKSLLRSAGRSPLCQRPARRSPSRNQ